MAKQNQAQKTPDNCIDENNEFLTSGDRASFIQSMLKAGYKFQSDNDNTMTFIEVATGNEVQVRH